MIPIIVFLFILFAMICYFTDCFVSNFRLREINLMNKNNIIILIFITLFTIYAYWKEWSSSLLIEKWKKEGKKKRESQQPSFFMVATTIQSQSYNQFDTAPIPWEHPCLCLANLWIFTTKNIYLYVNENCWLMYDSGYRLANLCLTHIWRLYPVVGFK